MNIKLKANEVATKVGDAIFFAAADKIKGKLILTNQRIYFKPLQEKQQEYDLEIQPEEMKELLYFKVKKIFPYGLSIVTKQGGELRFSIKNRDSWSKMINRMC